MKKILLIIVVLFISKLQGTAQTYCAGIDTICLQSVTDTELCAKDTIDITPNVTSSVSGALFSYKWTDITNNKLVSTNNQLLKFATTSVGIDDIYDVELEVKTTVNSTTFTVKDTFTITERALPVININIPLRQQCYDDSIVYLNAYGTTPTGGIWHHWDNDSLISGDTFYVYKETNAYITSEHNVTYIYTNIYGCTDSAYSIVRSNKLPEVEVAIDTIIRDTNGLLPLAPFVKKPTNTSLGSQVWSSTQIPDPVVLVGGYSYYLDISKIQHDSISKNKLTYKFTYILTGCTNEDSISVNTIPPLVFTINDTLTTCTNSDTFNLTTQTGVKPEGGKWVCTNCSGFNPIAVDSLTFNPAAKPSGYTYKLEYWYTHSGVTDTTSVTLKANRPPFININASSDNVCETNGLVNLSATPIGGVWSGAGVSGFNFNPGSFGVKKDDDNLLRYFYVDPSTTCIGTDSLYIYVQSAHTIDIEYTGADTICYGNNIVLKAIHNSLNGIVWSSDSSEISNISPNSVANQIIYNADSSDSIRGYVKLIATTANYAGNTCPLVSESITIYVKDCINSVQTIDLIGISAYPNPASDKVMLTKTDYKAYEIYLISSSGKVQYKSDWLATDKETSIQRGLLETGIYYIMLIDKQGNRYYHQILFN